MTEETKKVVSISSKIAASTGEPCQETIQELEKLLEKAKNGEIIGMALCFSGPGPYIETDWFGSCEIKETAAGIGLLQHRFFAAWSKT